MTVGKRIKKLREHINISQTELAHICKISKQSLYKYENDIITNIPSDKIEIIAKALGTTPAYLMGWVDTPAAPEPQEAEINKLIEGCYGKDTEQAFTMYVMLDESDKGEIRGEMKHMLKSDKYSVQDELKHA